MNPYSSLCDDFYINMNLGTEMELPANRETVLHFFERIQKTYPSMRNFYSRDRGDFVLEEDKDRGNYRWCTIEPRRVCSGQVNPDSIDGAMEQHRLVLELAPYLLSVSPLDCEALDLLFGFDFTYRGNHNQLVAEALGISPSLERIADPTADAALRAGLSKLKGNLLIGVINSIGKRRDAEASPALAKMIYGADAYVARAAAAALGNIGGVSSMKDLQAALAKTEGMTRMAVADAGLVCAERLLAEGKRDQALALYASLSAADVPKPARLAAMSGIIREETSVSRPR